METLHRDTARTYRQSDDTATLTGREGVPHEKESQMPHARQEKLYMKLHEEVLHPEKLKVFANTAG